jgi:hypothetical protein
MLHTVEELRDTTSEIELSARLGDYLGLAGRAPQSAVRRAIVDEKYCRYLLTARGQPGMLEVLFRDPANEKYADVDAPAHSSLALVMRAGKALAKWGASGFATVEQETFDARFAACQACDLLAEPPKQLLYRVRLGGKSDQRVCSACGCPAGRKAKLATEHCPIEDPARPGFNRWGEAMQERE